MARTILDLSWLESEIQSAIEDALVKECEKEFKKARERVEQTMSEVIVNVARRLATTVKMHSHFNEINIVIPTRDEEDA